MDAAIRNKALRYGILIALLALFLDFIEYRFLMKAMSIELYILVIALLFTGTGIWLGRHFTGAGTGAAAGTFQRNSRALDYLEITERELEVLELVAEGLSNKEIAGRLFVSVNTVKTHLSRLYSKMDVNRRTEAVEKARTLSIIP